MAGGIGVLVLSTNTGNTTIVNSGTIESTVAGGDALSLAGAGSNLVVVEHGYAFSGRLYGSSSATNIFELKGSAAAPVTADYNSLSLTNFGTVAFAPTSYETLDITNAGTLPGTIAGFNAPHDTIDLTTLSGGAIQQFDTATNQLTVSGTIGGSATTVTLQLDSSATGYGFAASADVMGGTDITPVPPGAVPVGSFTVTNGTGQPNFVAPTMDNTPPPLPIAGVFNINVVTITPAFGGNPNNLPLPLGYDGLVLSENGGATLVLLHGNLSATDNQPGSTIVGGDGSDTISGGDAANSLLIGGSGTSLIYGGSGSDTIYGGSGATTVQGGSGPATIVGGSGSFLVHGNGGPMAVDAGGGASTLIGGAAADTLIGGSGTNLIYAYGGGDTVYGGAGPTTVQGGEAGTTTTIIGEAGALVAHGNAGAIVAHGGSGPDTIIGGAASDTLIGGSGTNLIYAGGGNDTVYGGSGPTTVQGGEAGTTTTIIGEAGALVAHGNAGAIVAHGGSGPNLLIGGTAADTLIGGSGANTIIGGSGGDTIQGYGASNLIQAGSGADRIADETSQISDTVYGFDQAGGDRLFFSGETGAGIADVVANQVSTASGSTVTLPDGSTITLVGVAHIDQSFFG